MKRSTRFTTKYLTNKKKDLINQLFDLYSEHLQNTIDLMWEEEIELKKNLSSKQIYWMGNLGGQYKQLIYKQASEIVRSCKFKKGNKSKPEVNNFIINFDINCTGMINVGADNEWAVGVTNNPGTMSQMGGALDGLVGSTQGIPGPRTRAYTIDYPSYPSPFAKQGGDVSSYLDVPNIQTFYYQIERNTAIPGNDRLFVRRYTNSGRTSGLFQMQHNGVDPRGYRYLIFANVGVVYTGATFSATIANIEVISH